MIVDLIVLIGTIMLYGTLFFGVVKLMQWDFDRQERRFQEQLTRDQKSDAVARAMEKAVL